ncbi:Survival -like phosphatase nucleotidase [Pyrenophora seminiperda CCB06]|uniref:Survival-like phosphatase nucleotidase n=1 Tax=Pyrenophora seminiperda CCB06 TaxID=1302712 RepID=A0A3M7MBE8_9PLEO|nr:Survival -like phosphatase nucleotidase [Pyrenophora seminiperda CCB06]
MEDDILLLPIRIATSPALLKTYLSTVLLFITSTILFAVAVVAYSSFYYTYIPVRGITVPVYLQYDHSSPPVYNNAQANVLSTDRLAKWPYGLANVPGLVHRQKYDVVVEMDVPRSDTNLKTGNWMVGLEFRGPTAIGQGVKHLLGWDEDWSVPDHSQGGLPGATAERMATEGATRDTPTVLARSRRPVLLTYRSRILEMIYRLLRLPLYLVGLHTESEHVEISMMESVMFEPGYRNIPSSLRLEVRSRLPLEVYRTRVRISARLEGLRWLMYRYWITSALVGIGSFWGMEMGTLLFIWGVFTFLLGKSTPQTAHEENEVKQEDDGGIPRLEAGDGVGAEPETPHSDASRTFPTLPSQQPLSYSSSSVKEERDPTPGLEHIPVREEAEADDEDDDFVLEEPVPRSGEREGVFTDSGIGTSLESNVDKGLSRRRSGGGRRGPGG